MDVITFPSPSTQIHHLFLTSPENAPLQLPVSINPSPFHSSRGKCGPSTCTKLTQGETHQLFDEIPLWDTFAWNNLIQTHLTNGDPTQATATYQRMLLLGVNPDRRTLPRVLVASRLMGNLSLGKQLHCHVIKFGFFSDAYVSSSLIELYGQLEGVHSAKWYFRTADFDKNNAVAWTLLAGMYVKKNKPELAIGLFNEMIDHGRKIIDPVALVTVITACGMLKSLREGRRVHQIAKGYGLDCDVSVGNALLKMYADCGSVKDARAVFDGMRHKDAISWTAMFNGYVKMGGFNEGLKLFRLMNRDGIRADAFAVSSVLPACARVAAHKNGKEIHGHLIRNAIDMNVTVLNSLMDMYAKSGSIEYASRVFARIKDKDVISWTIMIMGYSLHGHGKLAVELYRQMGNSIIEVDEMTLAAVLYACYSACMVEEGQYYFNCIKSPKVAHCALMVALLARAGLFEDAKSFIEERKLSRHGEVLRALLDGCRIHQNLNTGRIIIEQLCELEPLNAENYVLLSNWFAHHENWDMVNKLRETIRDMNLRPRKAYSWIELKNRVHVFRTGDVSHPRSESVHYELQSLLKKVEAEGFRTISDFSLHDVDEERQCDPSGHCELLAISFGLINTVAPQTVRVTKNFRVCRNCHDFVKAISKEVKREIVIRDPNCFHHFKDGSCSCGQYW